MAGIRILIIFSSKDNGILARLRFWQMFKNKYTIEAGYLTDLLGSDATEIIIKYQKLKRDGKDGSFLIKSNEIYTNLEKQIQLFHPDVVIFHAGLVFRLFPNKVFEVIDKTKKQHPELRFGIEGQKLYSSLFPELDNSIIQHLFDEGDEIRSIKNDLFLERSI